MEHLNGFEFKEVEGGYEIKDYIGDEKQCLVLPSIFNNKPIVSVGENAFMFCEIKNIIVSETVKVIKPFAFSATSCEHIVLPNSLEVIEEFAFESCNLKETTLPKKLKKLGDMSFFNNPGLKIINMQKNKTTKIGLLPFLKF